MRIEARRARGVGPEVCEAEVILFREPLSFLGEVDPETGEVTNPSSPNRGRSIAGRALVIPEGRGSTVGSYVLYGLKVNGCAPAAILAARPDQVTAVGAVISDIPYLYNLDINSLRDGERIRIEGEWVVKV